MKKHSSKEYVFFIAKTGIFMALVCMATALVQIPIPLGYAHLGDGVLLLSTYFCGPISGIIAGSIGSMLADIVTGYAQWTLPTFIIKALEAGVAAIFFRMTIKLPPKSGKGFAIDIAGAYLGLIVMVIGYIIAGAIMYGSWASGISQAPGLLLKSLVNSIIFILGRKFIPKTIFTPKM